MSEWVQEAEAELARLDGRYAAKKRATIIGLVEARLAGRSEESVFGRDDTCSRNTYHSNWKLDPVFVEVLENVTRLAWRWKDGRALRALAQATEALALASPAAVKKAADLLKSGDPKVALQAAFGILDRAQKAAGSADNPVHTVTMSLEEWKAEVERRRQEAAETMRLFQEEQAAGDL